MKTILRLSEEPGITIEKDGQQVHLTKVEAARVYRDLHDLFYLLNDGKDTKPNGKP